MKGERTMQAKNNNARQRDERQRFVIATVAAVGLLQLLVLRFIPWTKIWEFRFFQLYVFSPTEILAVVAFFSCFATINYRLLRGWAQEEEITFLTAITLIYWIFLFPCTVWYQGALLHLCLLVGLLGIIGLYRLFYPEPITHQGSLIAPGENAE